MVDINLNNDSLLGGKLLNCDLMDNDILDNDLSNCNLIIDTNKDFDHFLQNEYLAYKNGQFNWIKVDKSHKIVGSIDTWQQSCPCISVIIYILKDSKVIYKYSCYCSWSISTEIFWLDENTNKKYSVFFSQNYMADDIQEIDNILNENEEIPNKLIVKDYCGLITKISDNVVDISNIS